jgi:hypothetical protein
MPRWVGLCPRADRSGRAADTSGVGEKDLGDLGALTYHFG